MKYFVEISKAEIEAIKFALGRVPSLKPCPAGGSSRHQEYDSACPVCDLRQDTPINVEERAAVRGFLERFYTQAIAADVGENNSGITASLDLAALSKLYFDTLRCLDRIAVLELHLEAVKKHVAIGAMHEAAIQYITGIVNDEEIPSKDGHSFVKNHLEAHHELVKEAIADLEAPTETKS